MLTVSLKWLQPKRENYNQLAPTWILSASTTLLHIICTAHIHACTHMYMNMKMCIVEIDAFDRVFLLLFFKI